MHRAHNGKPTFQRRDATGHLDPHYAADLRKRSVASATRDVDVAFLERPRSLDPLAEALGEEFLVAATTGEEVRLPTLDEGIPEEEGGPFVITRGRDEFARGRDGSNPAGATREPFPRSSSHEDAREERESRRDEEDAEG